MEVDKVIKSKIETDYFFVRGQLKDIDTGYFINRIEEGIKAKDNLNFQTNVVGLHTSFSYFLKDEEFLRLICKLIDYVEINNITTSSYCLSEAWGVKEEFGMYSKNHHHRPNYMSGIVYLNDHSSPLYLPDINEEIIPKAGKFCLFSAFLNHRTKRNLDNVRYCIPFNFRYRVVKE
tara:strand:- start:67 stop:594 length:528 start_codon:yes stop_codon:yes gene_type:complete